MVVLRALHILIDINRNIPRFYRDSSFDLRKSQILLSKERSVPIGRQVSWNLSDALIVAERQGAAAFAGTRSLPIGRDLFYGFHFLPYSPPGMNDFLILHKLVYI
jgi:hypothetical protein